MPLLIKGQLLSAADEEPQTDRCDDANDDKPLRRPNVEIKETMFWISLGMDIGVSEREVIMQTLRLPPLADM